MIKIEQTNDSFILRVKGNTPDLCFELENIITYLLLQGFSETLVDVVVNEAKKEYHKGGKNERI